MPIQPYREPVRAISGGSVYPGASLSVYDEEDALAAIYAESERITRLPNPIRADAAGYFPAIYVDPDEDHQCVLQDASGNEVFDLPTLGERSLVVVSDDDPRDAAGAPLPLATLTFLVSRTTELATVYGDDGFENALTNPVVANADGEFPDVYLPPGDYRVQLHAAPGNPAHPPALAHHASKRHVGGTLIYDVEMGGSRFYPLRYGVLGVVRTVFTPSGTVQPGVNQTWTRPAGVDRVGVLIVGGGGDARVSGVAASVAVGGGGGGGQVRYIRGALVTGDVTVRVPDTHVGIAQSFSTEFGDLVAVRGGGWHYSDGLEDGASGAGGAVRATIDVEGVLLPPGESTTDPQQGAGGAAWYSGGSSGLGMSGGGGGAGGDGEDAVAATRAGDGGPGVYMGETVGDDVGDDGWFGGGGGGGVATGTDGIGGAGGIGGGGKGRSSVADPQTHGESGTGGGGGGYSSTTPTDGRGGGGIVVVLHYDPDVHGPGYWPY